MKLKYISWLPAVIIMVLIFFYSSKQADNSNESSLAIANQILNTYEHITHTQYLGDEKAHILNSINHIVRKTAHFCEYAILAVTFAFHLAVIGHRRFVLFLLPILLSFCYAATDEFHQTFVSGRAGRIQDVLLDTCGGAFGSLLFIIIVTVITKKAFKKKI